MRNDTFKAFNQMCKDYSFSNKTDLKRENQLDYEQPDGLRVYYSRLGDTKIPTENKVEQNTWVCDDVDLIFSFNKSNTSSNFTIPTKDDYQKIELGYQKATEKVKVFPMSPGVYLMKDFQGRIIYIGKAKHLRNRVSYYFRRNAIDDQRVGPLVREIRDIDYLVAESEVDALLMEARLIKDIQPKYNRELKDDKSFPYLQITFREDFPRVEITHAPRNSNAKLYGPFLNEKHLRSTLIVLQRFFKFRTCALDINIHSKVRQYSRPCLLASIGQCSAPCCLQISVELYRKNIRHLQDFLSGNHQKLLDEIREAMLHASQCKRYELAAEYHSQLLALESLKKQKIQGCDMYPENFSIAPYRGVFSLQKILKLTTPPRIIEGIDIAHLSGQNTVASLVRFVDGSPFRNGYRRYRIKSVNGINDYASIAEVVARRFAFVESNIPFPELLLIDGGKGQLQAALTVLRNTPYKPLLTISLAKPNEEIFIPEKEIPLRLSRRSYALRLLQAVRDESHRFAQYYHHFLREKSIFEAQPAFCSVKKSE